MDGTVKYNTRALFGIFTQLIESSPKLPFTFLGFGKQQKARTYPQVTLLILICHVSLLLTKLSRNSLRQNQPHLQKKQCRPLLPLPLLHQKYKRLLKLPPPPAPPKVPTHWSNNLLLRNSTTNMRCHETIYSPTKREPRYICLGDALRHCVLVFSLLEMSENLNFKYLH